MYSISLIFACVLGVNSISGMELPCFEDSGIKHIAAKTPLTVFVPAFATRILNNTGKSVETIPNPKTTEIMTGGMLGTSKYQIHKGKFFWEQGKNGTSLVIGFYFYNIKYGNFQNALKFPDGILILFVPVETNNCIYNPLFHTFGGIFEKNIKKAGGSAFISNFLAYKWYDDYSTDSVYIFYKGSIHDDEIGQPLYDITILQLPKFAEKNFISKKQFSNTFGSLMNSNGNPMENPLFQIHHNPSSVIESKAISVIQTFM